MSVAPESSKSSKRNWPQYRSRHRQRSHDQAHEEHDPQQEPAKIIQHALVCSSPPSVIADPSGLRELLDHVREAGCFGYDSEFIGEHTYFPDLCLIQTATPQRVDLIDPLSPSATRLDLKEFWEIVADTGVEKVVHAGEPDLEPVVRNLNRGPQRIFDTQIAAAFAGLPYPMSLGNLLQELTGVELTLSSRGLKFSRWDQRPLSAGQLQYASDDVRYLPLMRQLLVERLQAKGNLEWAIEECQMLNDASRYRFDPQSQRIRVRGVDRLSARKRHVLRALIQWRDEAAREQNVPPRALLRDDVMFALANGPIKTRQDMKQLSGMPWPVEEHYGAHLVQLIKASLNEPLSQDTQRKPSEQPQDWEAQQQRIDAVWEQIQKRCEERSISPAIATSKRDLDRLVRAKLRGEPVEENRLFRGWRAELIGPVVATLVE
jgi:ribonuclease D